RSILLPIRDAQLAALRDSLVDRFAAGLREKMAEEYPRVCESLGAVESLAVVKRAIAKARSYGFHAAGEAYLYVDLTFAFGPAFETAPWARPLLESDAPAARRIEELIDEAAAHEPPARGGAG